MEEKPYCINPNLLEKLEKTINDFYNINPFELLNKNSPKMKIEEYRDKKGNLYALSCE